MPLFETLSSTEKTAVVFDIGAAFTKCGFAGESYPRAIVPSLVVNTKSGEMVHPPCKVWDFKDSTTLFKNLKNFFHHLYFKYLLVNPKERRVLFIESIFCPTQFRTVVARVLFLHFEIPSLLFAPSHLLSLFTLGIQTGLVLDCGYNESVAVPVFEGYSLLNASQSAPLAGKAIHDNIAKELLEKASVTDTVGELKPLSASSLCSLVQRETVLEDIKVRACFVSTIDRSQTRLANEMQTTSTAESEAKASTPSIILTASHFTYPLQYGQMLHIPRVIRELGPEVLFEMDQDQISVPGLILDVLLASPIDIRKSLAENIVVIGGCSQLPGFLARVKAELQDLLALPKYRQLSIKVFKFHQPPSKPNYTAWLGGSIFGALEVLAVRSLTRDAYNERRHELPDWINIHDDLQVAVGTSKAPGH